MQEILKKAQALAEQGRHEEAEGVLKSALAGNHANGPVLYRLGILAAKREDSEAAADLFSRALALAPDTPEILLSLATVRLEQGDRAAATGLAAKAERLTNSHLTLYRLGMLYRQSGEMEQAQEAFGRALKIKPDYIPAYYGLRAAGKFRPEDGHFERLSQLAESSGRFSQDDQSAIAFTLGRGYLDRDDSDRAFEKFAEGNRLKRALARPYDAAGFDAYIDCIMRLLDKAAAEKLGGSGDGSDRPVFIVGMPRSGSTLTDQILASHPGAGSIGESTSWRRSLPVFPHAEAPGLFASGQPSITRAFMDHLCPESLGGIGKKYITLTEKAAKEAARLSDKMLFNYLWVGVIRLALPNAKIVHCTRNPRDIALSLWQLTFPGGMQWTYDLRDIARYYRAYKKLMTHWNSVFPGDIHEVNYETMVQDQEGETRRLLAFCGLPWDARCLEFHESGRMVKTSSAAQVRKPIYADSVGKWKKYRQYLEPLLDALEE
jgi:tetratricopeptide (TPR) repeat protein